MKPDIKNLTLMAIGLILTVLECFVALTIVFAVVILLADESSAVHYRPCFARAQIEKHSTSSVDGNDSVDVTQEWRRYGLMGPRWRHGAFHSRKNTT